MKRFRKPPIMTPPVTSLTIWTSMTKNNTDTLWTKLSKTKKRNSALSIMTKWPWKKSSTSTKGLERKWPLSALKSRRKANFSSPKSWKNRPIALRIPFKPKENSPKHNNKSTKTTKFYWDCASNTNSYKSAQIWPTPRSQGPTLKWTKKS